MAPSTTKERYSRLFIQLSQQHRGVRDGVTTAVTQSQLEALAQIQDQYAAELGFAGPGNPMTLVEIMMKEIQERETAVAHREEQVRRREGKFKQQERVLDTMGKELKAYREKDEASRNQTWHDRNLCSDDGKY